MKLIASLIITGLACLILVLFFMRKFSPFDQVKLDNLATELKLADQQELEFVLDQMLEEGNIYQLFDYRYVSVLFLLIGGFIVSTVSAIHISIDKLFFKTVQQRPDIIVALRRSLLLYLTIIGLYVFYILNNLTLPNILLVLGLFIFIELAFLQISRNKQIIV